MKVFAKILFLTIGLSCVLFLSKNSANARNTETLAGPCEEACSSSQRSCLSSAQDSYETCALNANFPYMSCLSNAESNYNNCLSSCGGPGGSCDIPCRNAQIGEEYLCDRNLESDREQCYQAQETANSYCETGYTFCVEQCPPE